MKVCSICGKEKPWSEYHKDKSTASGYDHRCKPCNRERRKQYSKKPEVKQLAAQHMSEYRRRNKDKVQARNKVHYHLKAGNMSKPDACQNCGSVGPVQGHHHDYTKALDVTWLCAACHMEVHNAEQE